MKCQEVQEHLSAWLDGEVDRALGPKIAAHLEGCSLCQGELAQLSRLDEALGSLEVPAPQHLAARVLSRLPQPRPAVWWKSLSLAASLLLGIVLGGALAGNFYPGQTSSNGETMVTEVFQDFPRGSLGTLVVSYQSEEGNGA
ncbi:MAG: zf-HC2 domain-containing protein [Thermodesulfobacteriota bacterium]